MGIFKTKIWSAADLVLLKLSSVLFGVIIGAYLSNFVKQFLWIFIVLVIALGLRPLRTYWAKN